MSKRYIDADALLTKLPNDLPYKASVKRVLIQAPTADVVEVVRCKDCVHSSYYGKICHYRVGTDVSPEHYCSYGERKDDGK